MKSDPRFPLGTPFSLLSVVRSFHRAVDSYISWCTSSIAYLSVNGKHDAIDDPSGRQNQGVTPLLATTVFLISLPFTEATHVTVCTLVVYVNPSATGRGRSAFMLYHTY